MKKILKVAALSLSLVLAFGFAACSKGGDENPSGGNETENPGGQTPENPGGQTPENPDECNHHFVNGFCTLCGDPDPNYRPAPDTPVTGDDDFSYYEPTELREDKKLYVLNLDASCDNDELNTLAAMQGLFARKEVTLYIDGRYVTNGTNADVYYLERAEEEYGVTREVIDLAGAVELYKNAWADMHAEGIWGSNIPLATGFSNSEGIYSAYTEAQPRSGYDTPGYIVYRKGTYSVNVASTLAGITGFLPVEQDKKEEFDALGLVEKMDVTASTWGYSWLFNACLTELSPEGLVHQPYQINGNTNYYMRDYGVMHKYLHVFYDNSVTIRETLKKQIHTFLSKNIPILGYAYDETRDVALFSQYGQFLVPTDYTMNLTFHAAEEFRRDGGFEQPNTDRAQPAEQGKHYVAFIVSDGDNAQYWQNTAIFSTVYMNATGRENDDFPVTWSITPSLSDMMPLVMDTAYNSDITTENDYFCAPVSGQGYIDAGNFYNSSAVYMNDFLSRFDTYLGRSGLRVGTIIGAENNRNGIYDTLDAYSRVENLDGAIVYTGGRYFDGAYSGGVYWRNGKPFIVPRDSLWSTTPAYLAARVNMYADTADGTDITKMDAYTVINVHPWSHNYADIRTICGMLADNVEVVSVDRIVSMMRANVTDKADTVDHFNMPATGSGHTITDDMLRENPQSIPTDPLYNDFLLWCEDWTGNVTYSSSDASAPEAYSFFKTNMQIAGNGTANKAAFPLPAVDDLWISFYARAAAENQTTTAAFKLSLTVDGVEKTIISRAEMKGVEGTGSSIVRGQGWMTFAFPVSQYFADYKGKTASVKIENLTEVPVRIDRFSVTDRAIVEGEDTVCPDPYSNEFENGSTEDWMLGEQIVTSQYCSWGAYDHETLRPCGSLQIDASDGGGDEKRNGNINCWSAKCIEMNSDEVNLSLDISGRVYTKLAMYVDGEYIVIFDWMSSGDVGVQNYDLSALCAEHGIDSLNGKQVTFILEVRDSANNWNGVGEVFNMRYFRLG